MFIVTEKIDLMCDMINLDQRLDHRIPRSLINSFSARRRSKGMSAIYSANCTWLIAPKPLFIPGGRELCVGNLDAHFGAYASLGLKSILIVNQNLPAILN